MTKSRRILILVLTGCLWLSTALPVLSQTSDLPRGLPELLEFDRKLCPICQASERIILAVKAKYPGQFAVRKLYMDEEEKLFSRYKVALVPTQVFLDAAGQEVYRHEGVFKEDELIIKLRELKFIRD